MPWGKKQIRLRGASWQDAEKILLYAGALLPAGYHQNTGALSVKLSELLNHNTGESKLVFFAPHYLLQVTKRQHLINLLDMAISVRNVSFFILVLFYLRRASVHLAFEEKANRGETTKITGPWIEAIRYVLKKGGSSEGHYDAIFARQFFDLTKVYDKKY